MQWLSVKLGDFRTLRTIYIYISCILQEEAQVQAVVRVPHIENDCTSCDGSFERTKMLILILLFILISFAHICGVAKYWAVLTQTNYPV